MRRYVGWAFIMIAVLTLAVWGISAFVQPLLPSDINNNLILFFAVLFGVTGILAAFKDSIELARMLGERPIQSTTSHASHESETTINKNTALQQSALSRLGFLDELKNTSSADELEKNVVDLIGFIEKLSQGHYFAQKIAKLTERPTPLIYGWGGDESRARNEEYDRQYREQLINARAKIKVLIDELLLLQ
jgi:hypothetical protein